MSKVIMVQGTMSNAGKSLLVCGLCRIFKQDGYKVAPFKSQNMALNSYVTKDGLEMGRAQVMQAEAAGCEPDVAMNPILLKPTDNEGSQVIVNGKPIGNMKAKDYFDFKVSLIPEILKAYNSLADKNDIIVIEGAGSPAEINLRENDIVNMGMAQMVDAPVLLVGDIDRGGVFAQLLGTMMLLEPSEQQRVKGLIINKFRGDASLLDPGIEMLEEKAGVPVVGVVPYADVKLEDEDSLSVRFDKKGVGKVDIAVIRFPRISNFTDFDIFEQFDDVSLRYVRSISELGSPDMIILPGSKNTISDLEWMKDSGLADKVCAFATEGNPVFGICGGYQMLGISVSDPEGVEGSRPDAEYTEDRNGNNGNKVCPGGMESGRPESEYTEDKNGNNWDKVCPGSVEGGRQDAEYPEDKNGNNGNNIYPACVNEHGRSIEYTGDNECKNSTAGLGLLPVMTVLQNTKTTRQFSGEFLKVEGIFSGLSGMKIEGYEIHMGHTGPDEKIIKTAGLSPEMIKHDCDSAEYKPEETADSLTGVNTGNIYGTYIHGVFDRGEIAKTVIKALADNKGVSVDLNKVTDYKAFKETQYDKLADILRDHLDMETIYSLLK